MLFTGAERRHAGGNDARCKSGCGVDGVGLGSSAAAVGCGVALAMAGDGDDDVVGAVAGDVSGPPQAAESAAHEVETNATRRW